MSLLSVVQTACQEVGLPVPTQAFGNADANIIQMVGLANRAGKYLAHQTQSAGYWQQLRKQFLFTLISYGPYTCTITPGSNVLTNLSSMTGIALGQIANSTGLLNDSIVTNVNVGASQVTLSENPSATSTITGASVTFGQELYPLPSDFGYFIVQTGWDRNFRWQLLGPLDAQEWQVIKSGISPVGPRVRFRIMQNQIAINPVPSSSQSPPPNDLIVFEYVSNQWVATSASPTVGAQSAYLTDTDVSLVSEDVITLALKWRFLSAKGLPFDTEKAEYDETLARVIGRSALSRSLPLNAQASGIRLLNSQNVPDTGFGS